MLKKLQLSYSFESEIHIFKKVFNIASELFLPNAQQNNLPLFQQENMYRKHSNSPTSK